MSHLLCYLAGPVNGCTDDEANNWRDIAKARLSPWRCLDPMRRDYRGREDEAVAEIVQGDIADIGKCGVVLANCWQVSWGTAMEVFYAHSKSKRVIAVLPPGARISPWLRYHTEVVDSLTAALDMVVATPGWQR